MKYFRNRIASRLPLAALVLIATLALMSGCAKKGVEEIKIGAVLPLTGNSALWGQPTKEGIDLALELVNGDGGIRGKTLVVVYEDTQGNPATGVAAIKKLIDVHKISAVIDNSNSSVTLAMAPIVEKNHVVLLVTGASSPDIADAGEYVFRIWNSDALEGALVANYATDSLRARTAGVLYVNNSYGLGLNGVFSSEFNTRGGRVLVSESFDESTTDFRSTISKVLSAGPEILYLVAYPNQAASLVVQLKELGSTIPMIGAVALEDANFFKQAGTAADGLIYPLPAEVDTMLHSYNEFKTAFQKKYAKPVPFLAAEGFDGLMIIVEALKGSQGITGEEIKQQLSGLPRFDGVSGAIEFDNKGEVHKPFGMREIKGGKAIWRVRSF